MFTNSQLISVLIGSFITIITTVFFNIWKYRIDQFNMRCEDLVKILNETNTLAIEYWSTDFEDKSLLIKQAKLQSAQSFTEGLYEAILAKLKANQSKRLQILFYDYLDILTGENFGLENRLVDKKKLIRIPQATIKIIVELRGYYKP